MLIVKIIAQVYAIGLTQEGGEPLKTSQCSVEYKTSPSRHSFTSIGRKPNKEYKPFESQSSCLCYL